MKAECPELLTPRTAKVREMTRPQQKKNRNKQTTDKTIRTQKITWVEREKSVIKESRARNIGEAEREKRESKRD